ncbi:hypothetical protein CFOL_v3_01251 [Cephalotus follicularis]|uniref:Uncharacterized protein n=1 Tax=Cephalotus follicularis TaxID=3775 RepID=A0A1Q3AQ11_CEPFO|nr:hypothetical protein CFOL_v3_01251 [Cephalotus follicularis]
MRRREEKRRKIHEAILNTLYPPPPSPPEEEVKTSNTLGDEFDVELISPDDYVKKSGSSQCDSEDEHETGPKNLTRAQRKRLRKKKLKQDAARRGNMIGPLLLATYCEDDNRDVGVVVGNESPVVRQNAAEGIHDATSDNKGVLSACTNENKLKQRRIAKRVAKEKSKSSSMDNCDQSQSLKSSNELDPDQNVKSCDRL